MSGLLTPLSLHMQCLLALHRFHLCGTDRKQKGLHESAVIFLRGQTATCVTATTQLRDASSLSNILPTFLLNWSAGFGSNIPHLCSCMKM